MSVCLSIEADKASSKSILSYISHSPSNHEKSNAVVTPPTPQPQVAENIEKQKYSLTETEKRLRNLKKKLRTIEELKAKKQAGSILEDTQLAKIASEKEIADEVKEIEELLATTTTQKL
jgi:uncharacterized protein with WD repeat